MRLIDADQIRICINITDPVAIRTVKDVVDAIKNTPTIDRLLGYDIMPVIKCKNCKWFGKSYCPMFQRNCNFANDFCSFGERRTEDETN